MGKARERRGLGSEGVEGGTSQAPQCQNIRLPSRKKISELKGTPGIDRKIFRVPTTIISKPSSGTV
jgi:hypothetical protein